VRPEFGLGGFANLVGLRRDMVQAGRARLELTLRPEHLNPLGVVHGGVVYTLADTAMGAALTSRLEPDERCLTVEIKINYLTAATDGDLVCEAAVVERSRRLGVLEGRVHDGEGRLVALTTGTFFIIPTSREA